MWEIIIPSLPSEWVPGTMASRKLLSPTGPGRNLLIVVITESGREEERSVLAQKHSLRNLAGIHLPKKFLVFQTTTCKFTCVIEKVVVRYRILLKH